MKVQRKMSVISIGISIGVLGGILSVTPCFATNVAKVNDHVITDRDLNLALGGFNEGQRQSILKDPNSKSQVLDGLIDQEVMAQEALKLKMDEEPEFKETLANLKKQLLASRLLMKKVQPQVNSGSVKKYFETHRDKFRTDQVHVQHILTSSEEDAKKYLSMAKDSKNDFQILAEKYSKDTSAKSNRGDLGLVGRERYVAEFTDPIFAAQSGSIIGPIKTLYGYHVVKVLEKKMGSAMDFSEGEIRARASLTQDLTRSYAASLRKQAKIEVDRRAVGKM